MNALFPPNVELIKQAIHANLRERLELDSNPKPRPIRLIPLERDEQRFSL